MTSEWVTGQIEPEEPGLYLGRWDAQAEGIYVVKFIPGVGWASREISEGFTPCSAPTEWTQLPQRKEAREPRARTEEDWAASRALFEQRRKTYHGSTPDEFIAALAAAERDSIVTPSIREIAAAETPVDEAEAIRSTILETMREEHR